MLKTFTLSLVASIALQFAVKAQSPLLASTISYGYEYKDYYQNMYEYKHPFYNKNSFTKGDVCYFGRHYANVQLKYDIIKDQLVTLYTDNLSEIALIPEQVDSFSLYGQTFVRMTQQEGIPAGYYAKIYKGKNYVLYGRYTKSVLPQQFVNGGLYDIVSTRDFYYLKLDNKFHAVKSLKNLGELLSASKKQIKSFKHTDVAATEASTDLPSNHYLDYVKYYEAAK